MRTTISWIRWSSLVNHDTYPKPRHKIPRGFASSGHITIIVGGSNNLLIQSTQPLGVTVAQNDVAARICSALIKDIQLIDNRGWKTSRVTIVQYDREIASH